MCSPYSIKWISSSPVANVEGPDEYIKNIKGVADAVKGRQPVLVYFYSKKTKTTGKGKRQQVRPTDAASECDAVWTRTFDVLATGDVTLGMAAQYFQCIKVDVTNVEEDAHKYFNTEDVPLILLIEPDGSIAKKMKGAKSCEQDKTSSAMLSLLKKNGFSAAVSAIKSIDKVLGKRFNVEVALSNLKSKISAGKQRIAAAEKKKAKQSAIKSMKKDLASKVDDLKDLEVKRAKLLEEIKEEEKEAQVKIQKERASA